MACMLGLACVALAFGGGRAEVAAEVTASGGVRAELAAAELAEITELFQGTECTAVEAARFSSKLEIGAEHGRPCSCALPPGWSEYANPEDPEGWPYFSDGETTQWERPLQEDGKPCTEERTWGKLLRYDKPAVPAVALYLYPASDENGAFSLCDAGKHDGVLCHRLSRMMERYSLRWARVASVEAATEYVAQLGAQLEASGGTLRHLVLGGHGNSTSLRWGDAEQTEPGRHAMLQVGDAAAAAFFNAVRPLLRPTSTVFLDACENAKQTPWSMNMLNFVAHQLAGSRVVGSEICFGKSQMKLSTHRTRFGLQIMEGGVDGVDRAATRHMRKELATWRYYHGRSCGAARLLGEGVRDASACRRLCDQMRAAATPCDAFVYHADSRCDAAADCAEEDLVLAPGAELFLRPEDAQLGAETARRAAQQVDPGTERATVRAS